ncbi:hypothetical protein AFB00_15255 [Pseudonocardia sp. HH130630-07]|nr:hypothetical protein AFB00_15255 [Pseudonocardia sp. HH130630-07]
MRLLVAVVAAATTAVLVPAVGVAAPPPPASGKAVALNGVTDDGERFAASRVLQDPALGVCYDLTTPDGRQASWSEFVNGTNRVALVSTGSCVARIEDRTPLAAGERATRTVRSVRFSSIP